MQVRIDEADPGVVLSTVSGDLDADGAGQLRDAIEAQLVSGHRRFIVDCAGVGYASSAGIGALIHIHRRVRENGGRVLIAGAVGPVFEVLSLMNLGSILELYPDATAALAALGETSQTSDHSNG